MSKINLGIVGATGLVGGEILKVLQEENLYNKFNLTLMVSENSAGKRILFNGEELKLIKLNEDCLKKRFDVVIFSAGEDVSLRWAERFVEVGAFVIDNTNAFRKNQNVPLVIPEINLNMISKKTKIISNPNCSTIQLAVVIHQMLCLSDIESIRVSTYQSVSGAGKKALNDYLFHTNEYFSHGINNNIIPCIGGFDDLGFCIEENKIMFELNKILQTHIDIAATTVRVPIERCHGESVFVRFKNKVDIESIKKSLNCDHIALKTKDVFYVGDCAQTNLTYVCRLRKISDYEIAFFVIADNLRRGAAYNAVEILKNVIKFIA